MRELKANNKMSVSNKNNSGIHTGVTQVHEKSAMKETKKKTMHTHIKDIFNEGRSLRILMLHKTVITHLDELWVNYSCYNEGTICLVNECMDAKGMVFEHGCTDRHDKVCSGWYSGLVVPIYSIVGLLILYS